MVLASAIAATVQKQHVFSLDDAHQVPKQVLRCDGIIVLIASNGVRSTTYRKHPPRQHSAADCFFDTSVLALCSTQCPRAVSSTLQRCRTSLW